MGFQWQEQGKYGGGRRCFAFNQALMWLTMFLRNREAPARASARPLNMDRKILSTISAGIAGPVINHFRRQTRRCEIWPMVTGRSARVR